MSADPDPDLTVIPRSIVDPEAPWLGLRSFTEDTRAYFFGRDTELQDLFERIVHKPLTVLFGQSGLGKTSLLQAALIPRLRERGYLPILLRLDHAPSAPNLERQMLFAFRNVLLNAIRRTLRDACVEVPVHLRKDNPVIQTALTQSRLEHLSIPQDVESLWLLLHDPGYGFTGENGEYPVQPIFLFDQFEEVFTLGERPERRDASLAFRDTLACLVENRPPAALRARLENDDDLAERLNFTARPAKVLLTLREDFLHVLERWRRQMPSLMDNRLELRLLTGPQALQAVVEPGRMRGGGKPPIVSEETGTAIVRFVAGVRDDVPLAEIDAVPPLLSLICAELNARRFGTDHRAHDDAIRSEQLLGQSADILDGFYRDSFTLVPGAVRELVEDRLLSADGFRESLALDTAHRLLEVAGITPADARAAIGTLVDRRLLVIEERGGVRRIELTHDVLTGVARASRDQRVATEAAARAQQEKEAAEAAAGRIRRERNRLRRLAAVAVVCALAAAVAGGFGWLGSVRARRAAREADEAFATARQTTDQFLARIADEKLAYVPGIQDVREEMTHKAVDQYAALLRRRPDDAEALWGLLNARANLAEILAQAGSYAEAIRTFESSISEIKSQQRVGSGSTRLTPLLAKVQLSYGRFLNDNDDGTQDVNGLVDEVIASLEDYLGKNSDPGAALELARAVNLRGLSFLGKDDERAKRLFQRGRVLCEETLEKAPENVRILDRLSAATHNIGRAWQNTGDTGQARWWIDQAEAIQLHALELQPDDPVLNRNHSVGQFQKAKLLATTEGRHAEAADYYRRGTELSRKLAVNNPRVTSYRWEHAESLEEYAAFLSEEGDFESARRCYKEAGEILKQLVTKRDNRPLYGAALLNVMNRLAQFEEGGKGNRSESKPDLAAAERLREAAITMGRELVRTYPAALQLNFALGEVLADRAGNEPVKSNDKLATALLREAVALMQAQIAINEKRVSQYRLQRHLYWVSSLDKLLAKGFEGDATVTDERIALLDTALAALPLCLDHDTKDALLLLGVQREELHLTFKQADQTVALCLRLIEWCQSDYEAKPYYWYLRQHFGSQYKNLALAYQALGNQAPEIRAWQKWLEVYVIPEFGISYDDLTAVDLPATDANLERMRTLKLPSTKMFVIPCLVNGVKIKVQFYINNAVPGKNVDPLADQARWMEETRGVKMPEDVRVSIRKLAEIAHENNVGFADLCTYALNYNIPIQDATERLQTARSLVEKMQKASSEATEKLSAANAGLIEAYVFACTRARDEAQWKELADFARAWLALVGESPAAQSKLALALWFRGQPTEALSLYRKFWDGLDKPSDFVTAAIGDFESLSRTEATRELWDAYQRSISRHLSFPDVLDELVKANAKPANSQNSSAK